MMKTKWTIVSVVLVCAVIATIVGVMLTKSSKTESKSSPNPNDYSKNSSSSDSSRSNTTNPFKDNTNVTKKSNLSLPGDAKFTVTALAIGDWGQTIEGDSCCKHALRAASNLDKHAMVHTANLLAKAAKEMEPKPRAIITHGDNFYWTGINGMSNQQSRFDTTFEKTYNQPALSGIPWINVMGNHDYGGASFVCSTGGQPTECTSTAALLAGLKEKFDTQASYKSPNNDRWKMKDHYYVHSISDDASGISIDIFNIETNDADVHGAQQICCQCYGYSKGDPGNKCNDVNPGDKFCANGDKSMFDACMKQLKDWGQESRDKLKNDVKKSKATWKIVNTHYGTYDHYSEAKTGMWKDLLTGLGVQVFLYGHTHGEKHDYASFGVHFIENGAGGGIQSESPSGIPPYAKDYVKNLWSGTKNYPYGLFELSASKDWLKVRFITFDSSWNFGADVSSTTMGGLQADHCWMIPVDATEGEKCASS